MYLSAAGADVQSRRMELISNNLANVDTVGFKQQLAIAQARHSEAILRGESSPGGGSIDDVGGGVFLAESLIDFGPGAVKQTGVDTDFAIEGDGFFVVEKDGQQFLTRAGNFLMRADGRLTTQQGHSVLDAGGNPIALDPALPVRSLAGGILQQGADRAVLGLVRPQSYGDLAKAGENLFLPLAEPQSIDPEQRRVLPGHLEQSAVNPTSEMVRMIETSRAYEANVRMIQNHDSVVGSLVTRVLRS
jgi:flagellar basal body rod protein FlgG